VTRAQGRGWRWWGIGVLAAVVLVSAAAVVAGRNLGHWLVVVDPLEKARAVVVLTGDYPFRAMEAATIYREGWASEVWLQQASSGTKAAALRRLGFDVTGEEGPNRAVLVRLGVPETSIRVLVGEPRNTREEVDLVRGELARVGGREVILVTSAAHSRRVGVTWRRAAEGSARAIVRVTREDPFEPGAWWRSTADALAVSREVLGLLNAWADFPVRPARP